MRGFLVSVRVRIAVWVGAAAAVLDGVLLGVVVGVAVGAVVGDPDELRTDATSMVALRRSVQRRASDVAVLGSSVLAVDLCGPDSGHVVHQVEAKQMRALTEAELEAYFARHRAFTGAVETPHAVLIPHGGGSDAFGLACET
jgi:hypothetical protein